MSCGCSAGLPPLPGQTGGYRKTRKNRSLLRKYKAGKKLGFTARASLKAKGLIPRSSRKNRGKYIVSKKYL